MLKTAEMSQGQLIGCFPQQKVILRVGDGGDTVSKFSFFDAFLNFESFVRSQRCTASFTCMSSDHVSRNSVVSPAFTPFTMGQIGFKEFYSAIVAKVYQN